MQALPPLDLIALPQKIQIEPLVLATTNIKGPKAVTVVNTADLKTEMTFTKQDLEATPELDKKREYIVKEILHTEKAYVSTLETAVRVCPVRPYLLTLQDYYHPMKKAAMENGSLPINSLKTIFGNIEIILPLNRDHFLTGRLPSAKFLTSL